MRLPRLKLRRPKIGWKRAAKIAAYTLAALVFGVPLLVIAVLQTDTGRNSTVGLIESVTASDEMTLSLGTLEGSIPFDMRLSHVSIADRDGTWLEARGIALDWRMLSLLTGHVDITSFEIDRLTLNRPPAAGEAPPEEETGGGGLPGIAVTVGKIRIGAVSLHENMPGGPATFSIDGGMALNRGVAGLTARLNLARLDEPGGKVAANLDFDPTDNHFRIDVKVQDPEDGLLARLFERPGMPVIDLSILGEGTPANFKADLLLTAGDREALKGAVNFKANETVKSVDAALSGDLAELVPKGLDDLLGGPVDIAAKATLGVDQSIVIEPSRLRIGAVAIEIGGHLGRPDASDLATLAMKIGKEGGEALTLPGAASLQFVRLDGQVGKARDGLFWRLLAQGRDVQAAGNTIGGFDIRLDGGANAGHLQKATTFPVRLTGTIGGVDVGDARANALIGQQVSLSADAVARSDGTVKIAESAIRTAAFVFGYAGDVSGQAANGRVSLIASDLTKVAEQSGQSFSGSVDIGAEGNISFSGAPIDVALSGRLSDFAMGIAPVDGTIGGDAKLTGNLSRDEKGQLLLDNVAFDGSGLMLAASGTVTPERADLDLEAQLKNLTGLDKRLAGALAMEAHLNGPVDAPELRLAGEGTNVTLNGVPLDDPRLDAAALLSPAKPSGAVSMIAKVGDADLDIKASMKSTDDGAKNLEGFRLIVGRNVVEGTVTLSPEGMPAGTVSIKAPDLAQLAPLALMELSGAVVGRIDMDLAGNAKNVDAKLTAKDVKVAENMVGAADIDAKIIDPLGALSADATVIARNVNAGGARITQARVKATPDDGAILVDAAVETPDAKLRTNSRIKLAETGFDVLINELIASHGRIAVKTAAPAHINSTDGRITIDKTVLSVGAGRVSVAGTVDKALDLAVDVKDLPLTIVNAVAPGTGARGTLNASAKISGTPDAPSADWRVNVAKAGVAAARQAGIPAIDAAANGVFKKDSTSLDLRISGIKGLNVTAKGSAPASPTGNLNIAVRGSVPFTLISRPLADAGAALNGAAKVAIDVTGPAGSPAVNGKLTMAGVTATHVDTGVVIRDLAAAIALTTKQIRIEKLTGRLDKGGQISAGGEINIAQPGIPGNLSLNIKDGRYIDGTMVAANFNAGLKVEGQLATAPKVAGKVTLERVEVNIPENVPGGSAIVAVKHKNAPKDVERQAEKIAPPKKDDGGGTKATMDLTISAPSQIFIRGRGLDTELGGTMTMRGPLAAPLVEGGFSMRRGKLDLLNRRLDFSRGVVTFAGDFDPQLDFSADTKSGDISIIIKVFGSASAPEFSFTSSPELPQDEVLARFLFDRGVDKLSALQIAQLAASINQLRGGGPGALDKLRQGLGVDNLDVTTDEKGKSQVSAGKHITENVYLGVKQGSGRESTRVTIDLDVTDNVKARGEVGNDGSSKAGIYFEKDF